MNTYIAYFDETGDDGVTSASSDHFILTSLYMPAESWQQNFNLMRGLRKELRDKYGFHVTEEMHTKHFLTDKNPYRDYNWSKEIKQEILKAFTLTIAAMRKTTRAIRAFNPIQSKYSYGFVNQPITNMIEDIMEKNSAESYFIQICDFVSFFVHLYFKNEFRHEELPKRVGNVIDDVFVKRVMATLKNSGKLNLKANESNTYGLVI